MKTLRDTNVSNKKVLVRCDFNVPINETGEILDDFRITQALPTIKYLIEKNAKVILMSHLGEPEACLPVGVGKCDENLKLDNVAKKLSELLGVVVLKLDDCIGEKVKEKVENLKIGEVILLENLRFYKEETENNENFAKELSLLICPTEAPQSEGGCGIYINEAFSVCHRNNASVSLLPNYLPACAGFLLEKEILNLNKVLGKSLSDGKETTGPMTAIIGGKKVETKSKFINAMSEIADFVLIGDLLEKEIIEKNIVLNYPEKVFSAKDHLEDPTIEKETIRLFKEKILQSKIIIWNGPLSKTEKPEYAQGTLEIANAIIDSKAFSVVGGGETVEFLRNQGIIDSFSHVSTGGGAMIAYLSGEVLPGIEALKNSKL